MYHFKLNKIMKKILIIFLFLAPTLFSRCGKFLDMVPEKDIETIESIFEIRNGAYDFYNSCFEGVIKSLYVGSYSNDPSYLCGGEYAVGKFARTPTGMGTNYLGEVLSICDGYQNTNTPYCNLWTMYSSGGVPLSVYACIRYCNIFIENVDKVNNMSLWEKRAWKAEIQCLKAFYYFEMMKRYGPIVLVPNNIQSNADIETMQPARSHVDTCFNTIVDLFDEAIPHLRTRKTIPSDFKSCFTVEAALAYKARVLLYAASPLFNGNSEYAQFKNRDGEALFSSTPDLEKWKRAGEAADEAIRVCEANGIFIYKGGSTLKTKKLNDINNIRNTVLPLNWQEESEWIFMQCELGINAFHQNPVYKQGEGSLVSSMVYGHLAPNIETVELFYTENGLPITKDKTWEHANRYKMSREANAEYTDIVELDKDILYLHLRREPRFYANIIADGTYDVFSNKLYKVEPYKGQSRGTQAERFNDGSKPQNITGYWSKKFIDPTYNVGNAGKTPIMLMRLSDLYLMQAEAWNEYSGPSDKVYDAIDAIRERAGIPAIRKAWAQHSTSPEEIKTQGGLRNAIRQERKIEFVFEGHHCWDLRRWKIAEDVLNKPHKGWNVMKTDAQGFYNDFTLPGVVSAEPKFISPRDYFWPIKSEEIMISNIVQNPGW